MSARLRDMPKLVAIGWLEAAPKIGEIVGKKLLSLNPVVRTRKSYKSAGLIKRQKSFQGLAMYGHEVFDVLTKASKVIRDTLLE
jgi:hypothetical protein